MLAAQLSGVLASGFLAGTALPGGNARFAVGVLSLRLAPLGAGVTMLVFGPVAMPPPTLSANVDRVLSGEQAPEGQAAEERQHAAAGTSPGNRTSQTIEGRSFHDASLRSTSPGQRLCDNQNTLLLNDCSSG